MGCELNPRTILVPGLGSPLGTPSTDAGVRERASGDPGAPIHQTLGIASLRLHACRCVAAGPEQGNHGRAALTCERGAGGRGSRGWEGNGRWAVLIDSRGRPAGRRGRTKRHRLQALPCVGPLQGPRLDARADNGDWPPCTTCRTYRHPHPRPQASVQRCLSTLMSQVSADLPGPRAGGAGNTREKKYNGKKYALIFCA